MKTIAMASAIFLASAAVTHLSAADVDEGERLARQWCSACHLVGDDQPAAGDAAPPFASIAESAAARPDDLEAWLADPHPPMPNLDLTRTEIDDIVAYIESLDRN